VETLKASVLEKRETVTKLRDEAGKWRIQVLSLLLSLLAVLVLKVQILTQNLQDEMLRAEEDMLLNLRALLVQKYKY
jgi:hypothetical protein